MLSGSILDNIRYGLAGAGREASLAEVQAAARQALAHEFISNFPEGYNTIVRVVMGLKYPESVRHSSNHVPCV